MQFGINSAEVLAKAEVCRTNAGKLMAGYDEHIIGLLEKLYKDTQFEGFTKLIESAKKNRDSLVEPQVKALKDVADNFEQVAADAKKLEDSITLD